MTYLSLGSVPADEKSARVGERGYYTKAMRDCTRYVKLLRETFGPEPSGVRYKVMENLRELGDVLEVVVSYDSKVAGAAKYAAMVAENAPKRWGE